MKMKTRILYDQKQTATSQHQLFWGEIGKLTWGSWDHKTKHATSLDFSFLQYSNFQNEDKGQKRRSSFNRFNEPTQFLNMTLNVSQVLKFHTFTYTF